MRKIKRKIRVKNKKTTALTTSSSNSNGQELNDNNSSENNTDDEEEGLFGTLLRMWKVGSLHWIAQIAKMFDGMTHKITNKKEGQIKASQKSGGKGRRAYIIWECESDSSKAIRLTPEDSEKTTFTTDADNYYKVMHFGLKNIDATYQRMMNKVFKNQIYMSRAGSIHERHDC
jgi:carbon monoxide dehydrogenase subunit G